MCNSLYMDALTGLNNLLSLISADVNEICGNSGTVLYTDTKGLMKINEKYGHEFGDLYIAACASQIAQAVISDFRINTAASIYRVSGDDFLVIIKNLDLENIDQLAGSVDNNVAAYMLEQGVPDTGIHYVHWKYSTTPQSASELIVQAYILMHQEASSQIPFWVICLLRQIYKHINDTLAVLEKTSEEALIDTISQLPNNKAARQFLSKVYTDSTIGEHQFSVLFLDGDNLRRANEVSYQSGNELIKQLGNLIKTTIRMNDNEYRWLSGDEFLVVLPDTARDAAMILAERLRSTVESASTEWDFPVTVSLGVSTFPTDGATIEDILTVAEKRNSQAKKEGKNCIR